MKNLLGENTDLLLKHFKKNKTDLVEMILYLDRHCPSWRNERVQYLLDLQKLEKRMLKK